MHPCGNQSDDLNCSLIVSRGAGLRREESFGNRESAMGEGGKVKKLKAESRVEGRGSRVRTS